MRRVGFIPDTAPLTMVSAGASLENEPQDDAVGADICPDTEQGNEPAAMAESEPDAEPNKRAVGRKSRRKADDD